MKPKKIILIRHGESEGNADKSVYSTKPDYALSLSENGFAQAVEAGKKLKELINDESVYFYISPFWRARMTFESIVRSLRENPVTWIEEPRIREQDWGHLKSSEECMKTEEELDKYGPFY